MSILSNAWQMPPFPVNWSDWGGIATVFAVAVAAIAAWPAYRQFAELVRTRKLQALSGVFEIISSERARTDRRYVFHHLTGDTTTISPTDRDAIERVAVDFEQIGSLMKHGLVPKEELLVHHAAVIARTWQVLKPYIDHRNEMLKGNYAQNFRWLGIEARSYLHRMGMQGEFEILKYVPDRPTRQVRRRR